MLVGVMCNVDISFNHSYKCNTYVTALELIMDVYSLLFALY